MPPNSFVLIGAGSTVFTPGLMTDLASSPVFAGWTIHLVDLSAEAAQTMAGLGRRIAKERGADLTFGEQAGGADAPSTRREGVHLPVSADLLRTFGRYPAPGDRHVSEFFSWYLRGTDGDALPWGCRAGAT